METQIFNDQIKRLKSQWPNAYGDERIKILWAAFKDVANYDFRDAVTHCLGTAKSAPLVPELEKAVLIARNNYYAKQRMEEANVLGALEQVADNNTTADPEFVDKCLKLLDDLYQKKITKVQFDEGCNLLDQAAKLYKGYKKKIDLVPPKMIGRPYKDDDEDKPF
jgi:hypothetical protein